MKRTGILVIVLLLSALPESCGKKQDGKGELTGKIIHSLGTVTINGKNPGADKSVKYGDVIETGKDGTCSIQVGEKSIFRINTGSKLTFNISRKRNDLVLERGWFTGITRKIFTTRGKYFLKTPTVTAAIRGTSYCVKVENPKSTYFCVCNGTIALAGPGERKGRDVSAAHHIARRFKIDKEGKLEIDKSPGMLYHEDKTLEDLAAKISEKIDWKKAF